MESSSLRTVFGRALARRCPSCGERTLFKGLVTVFERCSACGLEFNHNGESLGFYYLTTVALTGAFVIGMYLIVPRTIASGQRVVMPLALAAYLATWPFRKALAIALNYRFNPART